MIQKDRKYSMHDRENALKEWLTNTLNSSTFILQALTSDASFRKYYRVQCNGISQIVMDAPPDKEGLNAFIHIAQVLSKSGVLTPEILAQDLQQGFLLLSDFGDKLLLDCLNSTSCDKYYNEATNVLLKIQQCPIDDPMLPSFDQKFMLQEMNLCSEWFFKRYLSLKLSDTEHELFNNTIKEIASALAQLPQVFMHRDYHSRNIMMVNKQQMAVIDFQDAVRGPVAYDLVSLLKDCYISWPRTKVLEWVELYYRRCPHVSDYSLKEFIHAFDLCGLQRHLKVLGIFSRLKLRDNKPGYLKDLPLTLKYVLDCSEIYEEFRPLNNLLQKRVYLP